LILSYTCSPILIFSFIILLFFFSLLLRPPSSTLFPSRRSSDLLLPVAAAEALAPLEVDLRDPLDVLVAVHLWDDDPDGSASQRRSEEHTSELQSQSNLVCRLLLEKKKKITI